MPENLASYLPAPLSLDLIATLPRAPAAYVLLGQNGRRYTGAARDLRERMRDHHAGRAERTKNQRPLILLHLEPLPTYADALRRERFLKSGQGRQVLDAQQTVPPEAGSP